LLPLERRRLWRLLVDPVAHERAEVLLLLCQVEIQSPAPSLIAWWRPRRGQGTMTTLPIAAPDASRATAAAASASANVESMGGRMPVVATSATTDRKSSIVPSEVPTIETCWRNTR